MFFDFRVKSMRFISGVEMIKNLALVLALIAVCLLATVSFRLYGMNQALQASPDDYISYERLADAINDVNKDTEKKSEDIILRYLISDKTDKIIDPSMSDKDKAVALAKWVGTHWRNHSNFENIHASHKSKSLLEKYVNRMGACGTRTDIFVYMAERAGLKARRFSIYNFGHVGGGHTTAQVYYDDDWHFFDVTFSGYFEKDGEILSYKEMLENKENLHNYMVVFDSFGEVSKRTSNPTEWGPVENLKRMKKTYDLQNMNNGTIYGFVGLNEPVMLTYNIDSPTALGKIDKSNRDVKREAINGKISEQIERFGFFNVPFHHVVSIQDKNIKSVTMTYHKSDLPKDFVGKFEAIASNCSVSTGASHLVNGGGGRWTVTLSDVKDECTLTLKHNIETQGRGVWVDQLSFL